MTASMVHVTNLTPGSDNPSRGLSRENEATAAAVDDNNKSYYSTTSKGGLGFTTAVTTAVTTTLGDALMHLIEAGCVAVRKAVKISPVKLNSIDPLLVSTLEP